ncbi:hypothetical protein [Kosakonia sacchari]|uniref:hypothetical protein n=1 Tax=Kosakonia sacchari TaxID=1158459 RepID=UPI0015859749|nr:hypothetical protein [Kosakonia sacchari]NUL35091.1 hypothetical protein [Kosakonia sacchari]
MTNNDEIALKLKEAADKLKREQQRGALALAEGFDFISIATPENILALLAERDADKKRIAELEAAASCKFMPVGVMSQSKFESLDNGDVRFIALWPRPCVPVRRKRPDDGVLVYAKVADINLE